jgi:hypothetical protein
VAGLHTDEPKPIILIVTAQGLLPA